MPARVNIGDHEWRSNLFECRGEFHRIVLVSHVDDDTLRSFAHSWGTIGELAALERPVTLTIVIVGSQRGGRRHSAWSRAYQHPVQKNLRFAPRKKDNGFTGNWTTVWREQGTVKADVWLNQMRNDEVLDELIVSRRIQYNASDARMIQARKDMLTIADRMEESSPEAPMRRSSCDEIGRGPCPFQPICYSQLPVSAAEFPHLFSARETPLVTLEAKT